MSEYRARRNRGVTEGTPRSPFCSLYAAMPARGYRAVAKRRSAYAAMPVETLRSPFCFLYTAMMSGYRAVAKRRSAYAAITVRTMQSPCVLSRGNQRADFGSPRSLAIRLLSFLHHDDVGVSRRREKKKRLRRDDRRDAAIPLLFSLHRDDVGVSRPREKKGRLRRDACSLRALCVKPCFFFLNKPI